MNTAHREAGFTLIETIVVVTITALLAGLAAPSFREFIANTQIQASASDLQASLLLARSEAVKRNAPVTVVPAAGGWASGWEVRDQANNVLQVGAPNETVDVTAATGTVTFLASGRLAGGTLPAFEILDAYERGEARCLSADRSGRAYVRLAACS